MKNLVVSWWNCLKMLAPANLMPLVQVTLKALLEVYKTVFKYFWWFAALGLVMAVRIVFFCYTHQVLGFALIVWIMLWVALLFLVARPSVALKDSSYFFHHSVLWLLFAGILFGVLAIPLSIAIRILLIPYVTFLCFFTADANSTLSEVVRAPWRALKMSLALVPFYVLTGGLLYAFMVFLKSSFLGALILIAAILPLFIVFMSRLYVITIHKNYKEYYERCW